MKTILFALLVALPLSPLLAQASAPAPVKGPSFAVALKAAQTAVKICSGNGFKVAVSVVDAAGVLKVMLAADGAHPMAVTSSQRKAMTTITYKVASADIEAKAKSDATLAGAITANPALFARAGAQPLVVGGEIIGAVGVGGAPGGEKDDICALAAVAAVQSEL